MFAARSMITKNDYAERAAIEEQLFVESPDGMAFLLLLLISRSLHLHLARLVGAASHCLPPRAGHA